MEITKQEKKALDKLNSLLFLIRVKFKKEQKLTVSDLWWIEAILNLIYKVADENEKNKNELDKVLVHIDDKGNIEPVLKNYIPKDLVIKKIQEQNNKIITYSECFGYEEANQCNYCRIILEELLEGK